MLTVSINVLVTFVSELVHVRVFLVVVLDGAAVVAGIAEVVFIHVALVHVGHQNTVVLAGRNPRKRRAIGQSPWRSDDRLHTPDGSTID